MSIPADRSRLRVEGHASTRRIRLSCFRHSGRAAERLTDDLLVEILSRVPAKSLCRFKCVSNHWLGLINDPHHRKKLPQTLAGFFHSSSKSSVQECFLESPFCFTSVSGSHCPPIDTSFAFLPNHPGFKILDCCNGLLLCRWYISAQGTEFSYVVCNPATEKWVMCDPAPKKRVVPPESGQRVKVCTTRLGFDPAVSPHFYVFEMVVEGYWCDIDYLTEMEVYSSETGKWVHKKNGLNRDICLINAPLATVFLNGYMHFHAFDPQSGRCLAAVDTEGKHGWAFVYLVVCIVVLFSGQLHYANFQSDEDGVVVRLVVYVLKDYGSKEWMLKHSVETSCLFGGMNVFLKWDFKWIAIHPDCNLIFFTAGRDITFMCYNMDNRQVKVICNLNDGKLPYLPYVPLYSELQSLGM